MYAVVILINISKNSTLFLGSPWGTQYPKQNLKKKHYAVFLMSEARAMHKEKLHLPRKIKQKKEPEIFIKQ